ncbi:MAG: DUF3187 family protein [bacterium JZ-2024 1]
MKKFNLFAVCVLVCASFPCIPSFRPIAPPLLGILHHRERMECSEYFSAGYSLFVFPYQSKEWRMVVDLEMISLEYGKKWDFERGGAVEVFLPVYYTCAGFMDSFVLQYHQFLGLSPGPRKDRPKNEFTYVIQGPQGVVQKASSGLGAGDPEIRLSFPLSGFSPQPVFFALSADLPLGSENMGFSNGKMDWGLSLSQRREHRSFQYGWSVARFFPASYGNVRRIPLRDFTVASMVVQFRQKWLKTQGKPAPFWIQFRWMQSPFPPTGVSFWDQRTVEIFMGAFLYRKNIPWFFGFSEDLVGGMSPDISFLMSVSLQ